MIRRFSTLPLARFSVLGLAAWTAILPACGIRGQHNQEFVQQAREKIDGLKSGLDWQMAQQQFLAGDLDKALKTVDSSIALNGKVASAHILRARILMEKGDLEGARGSLLSAEKLDDKNAEAQYYLGVIFERYTQTEPALARYQRAAELDSKNAQYLVAAADMLVESKRLDEADALLANPPETLMYNAAVKHTRGRLAMRRGDSTLAESLLEEARLLSPDDSGVLEDLLRAQMSNRRFNQAELTASQLLKQPGAADRSDLKVIRSQCLVEIGQLTEARKLLGEVTERSDADRQAWLLLGEVSARLQDHARLRAVGSRLIALAPERYEGYLYRAMHLRGAGQLDAALESATQATARAGSSGVPFVYRAILLKDANRLGEARSAAVQAAQVDPESKAARQLIELIDRSAAVAAVGTE